MTRPGWEVLGVNHRAYLGVITAAMVVMGASAALAADGKSPSVDRAAPQSSTHKGQANAQVKREVRGLLPMDSIRAHRPQGKVKLGSMRVMGTCSKAAVQKVVLSKVRAFNTCYSMIKRRERRGGKVNFQWAITPSGKASGAKVVRSSLNHPKTEACFVRQLQSLQFSPPAGGGRCVVNAPMILAP